MQLPQYSMEVPTSLSLLIGITILIYLINVRIIAKAICKCHFMLSIDLAVEHVLLLSIFVEQFLLLSILCAQLTINKQEISIEHDANQHYLHIFNPWLADNAAIFHKHDLIAPPEATDDSLEFPDHSIPF